MPIFTRNARSALLAVFLNALAACPIVWAANPALTPPPSAEFQSLSAAVDALGSPVWAQRETAETFLARQSPARLPELESTLRQSRDPEVVARLSHIMGHLFLKQSTGFDGQTSLLGIRLNVETIALDPRSIQRTVAVAVCEVQPGFPSTEQLRAGDLILSLNGQTFTPDTTPEAFRHQIAILPPATRIQLSLLRGHQRLHVAIALAGVQADGVLALTDFVQERLRTAANYIQTIRPVQSDGLHFNDPPPGPAAGSRFDNF